MCGLDMNKQSVGGSSMILGSSPLCAAEPSLPVSPMLLYTPPHSAQSFRYYLLLSYNKWEYCRKWEYCYSS